ncbi:MAG: dihydrolipoyl dehydrogenase [Chloroflexota bacterium]
MDEQLDLVVIGAGPGGYVAAIRAAQLGMRAVIVERDAVGGVCLNRGCIPTKAMLRSAELLGTMQHAADYGILADNVRLDYAAVVRRREKVVKQLTGGVGALLQSNNVPVIKGTARLENRQVIIDHPDGQQQTIDARTVMLATGSVPATPPIPGADGARVIDSDGALLLDHVPASVLVIGGGAVGAEWANIFHSFGAQVTLVEMLPTLLPLEDVDMGKMLARSFSRRGITVHTGTKLIEIGEADTGETIGLLELSDGQQTRVSAEYVMIGIGRRPNTAGLGLEAAGITTDRRGFVEVDDHLRTNVPGIVAIGDITGKQLLAHLASHQGVVAVENLAGHDKVMDYRVVPSCTFTHPEVATVGLSESAAQAAGYDVRIGTFPFQASGRAMTYGETEGLVKVVSESKYGELLGVHIIGASASELIHEAALAIRLEATLDDLADTIHAHPSLAESIHEATLAACGGALHLPPRRR